MLCLAHHPYLPSPHWVRLNTAFSCVPIFEPLLNHLAQQLHVWFIFLPRGDSQGWEQKRELECLPDRPKVEQTDSKPSHSSGNLLKPGTQRTSQKSCILGGATDRTSQTLFVHHQVGHTSPVFNAQLQGHTDNSCILKSPFGLVSSHRGINSNFHPHNLGEFWKLCLPGHPRVCDKFAMDWNCASPPPNSLYW